MPWSLKRKRWQIFLLLFSVKTHILYYVNICQIINKTINISPNQLMVDHIFINITIKATTLSHSRHLKHRQQYYLHWESQASEILSYCMFTITYLVVEPWLKPRTLDSKFCEISLARDFTQGLRTWLQSPLLFLSVKYSFPLLLVTAPQI